MRTVKFDTPSPPSLSLRKLIFLVERSPGTGISLVHSTFVILLSSLILKCQNSFNTMTSLLLLMLQKREQSEGNACTIMAIRLHIYLFIYLFIFIFSFHGSDDEANFFSSAQRSFIVNKIFLIIN